MYRVYSGPRGSEPIKPTEKSQHLYKEFGALDEAMGFAHHLAETGRSVLLIEGDDGTSLDRQALARALRHRDSEQGRAH